MGTIIYGLEKEIFLVDSNGNPMVVPRSLPADAEGVQVELRGEPSSDIWQAAYSIVAEEAKIKNKLSEEMHLLSNVSVLKIPRDVKLAARRIYNKGILSYENLYNYKRHAVTQSESTAGIHVSVTNKCTNGRSTDYNGVWDYVKFIKALDTAFKEEIKRAKRRPGFYEFKSDGRIEYRSLPNNIDLDKLCTVIKSIKL